MNVYRSQEPGPQLRTEPSAQAREVWAAESSSGIVRDSSERRAICRGGPSRKN